jgi:hypothetical protein
MECVRVVDKRTAEWLISVPENDGTVNRITFPVFTKLITIAIDEKLNLEQVQGASTMLISS